MFYKLCKIATSDNWYVEWCEGRRTRRVSTRTRSRVEAQTFLEDFSAERSRVDQGALTVAEVLDWYLDNKEVVSVDTAKFSVKNLKRHLGSILAVDADISAQSNYQKVRQREGVKAETVKRELNVLSAALRLALKHKVIASLPSMHSIASSDPRERWATRGEVAAIFRHLRTNPAPEGKKTPKNARERTRHLLLFARLALYTGARAGAITDLTWDRVDLQHGTVSYPNPSRKSTKKGRAIVPIEPHMVRALTSAKRKAKTKYVIEYRGQHCKRIIRAFSNHMDALGYPDITPNTLRHTFATWASNAGQPLFLVGKAMGQSVVSTTARYAKLQTEALVPVVRAVRRAR